MLGYLRKTLSYCCSVSVFHGLIPIGHSVLPVRVERPKRFALLKREITYTLVICRSQEIFAIDNEFIFCYRKARETINC